MTIELTEKEQAVLNAACVRIEKATEEAQAIQRAAEQAARKAEALAHEARGMFRSIMELRGDNPEAHEIHWDGVKATIRVQPKAEAEPVAENVVQLPAPKEPATVGDT